MSSLLTSVVIELSKTENKRWCECCHDDSLLEDVLLEVQRLWPPFFGGRRISTQVHYLLQFLLSVCLSVATLTKNYWICELWWLCGVVPWLHHSSWTSAWVWSFFEWLQDQEAWEQGWCFTVMVKPHSQATVLGMKLRVVGLRSNVLSKCFYNFAKNDKI